MELVKFYAYGILSNIICCLGLLGNMLTLYILNSSKEMRKPSINIYLTVLTIYDNGVLIFSVLMLNIPAITDYHLLQQQQYHFPTQQSDHHQPSSASTNQTEIMVPLENITQQQLLLLQSLSNSSNGIDRASNLSPMPFSHPPNGSPNVPLANFIAKVNSHYPISSTMSSFLFRPTMAPSDDDMDDNSSETIGYPTIRSFVEHCLVNINSDHPKNFTTANHHNQQQHNSTTLVEFRARFISAYCFLLNLLDHYFESLLIASRLSTAKQQQLAPVAASYSLPISISSKISTKTISNKQRPNQLKDSKNIKTNQNQLLMVKTSNECEMILIKSIGLIELSMMVTTTPITPTNNSLKLSWAIQQIDNVHIKRNQDLRHLWLLLKSAQIDGLSYGRYCQNDDDPKKNTEVIEAIAAAITAAAVAGADSKSEIVNDEILTNDDDDDDNENGDENCQLPTEEEQSNLSPLVYYVKIVYPMALIAQTGSIWTTCLITIERYLAVCHPLRIMTLSTRTRAIWALTLLSIMAILFNLPRFAEVDTTCHQVRPTKFRRNKIYYQVYYIFLNLALNYILPLSLLSALNIKIYASVRQASTNRNELTRVRQSELHMASMLVAIVAIFIACNAPAFIVNCLEPYFDMGTPVLELMTIFSNVLVCFNSSINFVIYCIFGRKFRNKFMRLLRLNDSICMGGRRGRGCSIGRQGSDRHRDGNDITDNNRRQYGSNSYDEWATIHPTMLHDDVVMMGGHAVSACPSGTITPSKNSNSSNLNRQVSFRYCNNNSRNRENSQQNSSSSGNEIFIQDTAITTSPVGAMSNARENVLNKSNPLNYNLNNNCQMDKATNRNRSQNAHQNHYYCYQSRHHTSTCTGNAQQQHPPTASCDMSFLNNHNLMINNVVSMSSASITNSASSSLTGSNYNITAGAHKNDNQKRCQPSDDASTNTNENHSNLTSGIIGSLKKKFNQQKSRKTSIGQKTISTVHKDKAIVKEEDKDMEERKSLIDRPTSSTAINGERKPSDNQQPQKEQDEEKKQAEFLCKPGKNCSAQTPSIIDNNNNNNNNNPSIANRTDNCNANNNNNNNLLIVNDHNNNNDTNNMVIDTFV